VWFLTRYCGNANPHEPRIRGRAKLLWIRAYVRLLRNTSTVLPHMLIYMTIEIWAGMKFLGPVEQIVTAFILTSGLMSGLLRFRTLFTARSSREYSGSASERLHPLECWTTDKFRKVAIPSVSWVHHLHNSSGHIRRLNVTFQSHYRTTKWTL
jgi:hypothetical protein